MIKVFTLGAANCTVNVGNHLLVVLFIVSRASKYSSADAVKVESRKKLVN